MSTAACLQVIQDGAAAWGSSREGEDLRLSSTKIPYRELRRNVDLGFDVSSREGNELGEHSLAFGFRSNLARHRFRHDELVRELTQESDMSDLAKQNEG
ncbi:MAG TPA: hypothetical protein VF756_30665 [Thermoanaerobaculia bacterium]